MADWNQQGITRLQRLQELCSAAESLLRDVDVRESTYHNLLTALADVDIRNVNILLFEGSMLSRRWLRFSHWFRCCFGDYVIGNGSNHVLYNATLDKPSE